MRRYEYGDPLKVLERRGEDCSYCRHLERWNVAGEMVAACNNKQAPEQRRKAAPARRCDQWRHEKADSGV